MSDAGPHDPQEQIREFFDGEGPAPELSALDPQTRRAFAEELMVASATEHLLTRAPEELRQMVRSGVGEAFAQERRRRLRVTVGSGIVIAAAVLIAVLVSWPEAPEQDPVLARIKQAAQAQVDHHYTLHIESPTLFMRGLAGEVHAHGDGRFAVPLRLARGSLVVPRWMSEQAWWAGYDGKDYWLTIPGAGARAREVLRSPQSFARLSQKLIDRLSGDFPVLGTVLDNLRLQVADVADQFQARLSVQGTLARLDSQYSLEPSPARLEDLGRKPGELDLCAYRHPQAPRSLPESIRMLVDEQTGRARLLILSFSPMPGSSAEKLPFERIRFELQGTAKARPGLYAADARR